MIVGKAELLRVDVIAAVVVVRIRVSMGRGASLVGGTYEAG
jgi:hypothetical protein